MAQRNIAVTLTVKDYAGNVTTKIIDILENTLDKAVAGGYYLSGNGDMRADTVNQGMNLKGFTQYRSFADAYSVPGYQRDYLKTFVANGIWGNFVVEYKYYGATVGPQIVNGKTVPAPNMTIQQRPSTTWPKAYGYNQIISGLCNPLFDRTIAQINAIPSSNPINIQLASEFDTDHEFGITEDGIAYNWATADAKAVTALIYTIGYMKPKITRPNVTFTVGMGGFDRGAWSRMHPESLADRIDYLQFNVYRRSASDTAYQRFGRTKVWSDADLGPKFKKKDIIVAEWGTPASLKDQAAWIKTVPAAVSRLNTESRTGRFVMLNYFNSQADWALLNPKQAGIDALKFIYSSAPFKT